MSNHYALLSMKNLPTSTKSIKKILYSLIRRICDWLCLPTKFLIRTVSVHSIGNGNTLSSYYVWYDHNSHPSHIRCTVLPHWSPINQLCTLNVQIFKYLFIKFALVHHHHQKKNAAQSDRYYCTTYARHTNNKDELIANSIKTNIRTDQETKIFSDYLCAWQLRTRLDILVQTMWKSLCAF